MRVKESPAPRCPVHPNVAMKPVENLRVGLKAGRSGGFKFGVLRQLAGFDRWRCPVVGCTQVMTKEKSL